MIIRATKKPMTIQAIKFDGLNTEEVLKFTNNSVMIDTEIRNCSSDNPDGYDYPCVKVETLEGCMTASIGDYIIKGVQGEFYPCKPEIFLASYDIEG